mmetsp:Transcript_48681/g.90650  ORF Transcript_48681/g.90650 Transcript_48681/m.90650 type:complete len:153 (+) Transcript_48681:3-461(+)
MASDTEARRVLKGGDSPTPKESNSSMQGLYQLSTSPNKSPQRAGKLGSSTSLKTGGSPNRSSLQRVSCDGKRVQSTMLGTRPVSGKSLYSSDFGGMMSVQNMGLKAGGAARVVVPASPTQPFSTLEASREVIARRVARAQFLAMEQRARTYQ